MYYTHAYKPRKEDSEELDIKEDLNISKELDNKL